MRPWTLVLLGLCSGAPPATPAAVPQVAERRVPRLESAEAQLGHAARLRAALRSAKSGEREALTAQVVAAYRAVRELWPQAHPACAESAFRCGELLRIADRPAEARAEFEFVRAQAFHSGFRARAGLELGHLERRDGRTRQALEHYLAVVDDPKSEPARRDEAALWAGRQYALLERPDEARRHWISVARRAEDPLQRIDAWDELALALVEVADLEGAAGWLAEARESLSLVALEETEQGERVRNALEHMRAIRRLERAVLERVRAGPRRDAR